MTDTAAPNYLDSLAADIGRLVPDCPIELLRAYALLALTRGTSVSLENVHDAWSAWRAASRPDHPSLVPFDELSPEVQQLDAKYRDAIRKVASSVEVDDEMALVSRADLVLLLGSMEGVPLRSAGPKVFEAWERLRAEMAGAPDAG